jgi:hypothetical protein
MKTTNNWGKPVKCVVCKTEELHDYNSYTPPFANAMNSVYVGWCKDHEKEGIAEYNKGVGYTDRVNQASSNS